MPHTDIYNSFSCMYLNKLHILPLGGVDVETGKKCDLADFCHISLILKAITLILFPEGATQQPH
jgi:hypothetical protein